MRSVGNLLSKLASSVALVTLLCAPVLAPDGSIYRGAQHYGTWDNRPSNPIDGYVYIVTDAPNKTTCSGGGSTRSQCRWHAGSATWEALSAAGGGGGSPGGSETEFQFHDTGTVFGGATGATYDKATQVSTMLDLLTKQGPVFNVKAWGALGDGTCSDSDCDAGAFDAAIDQAITQGGGIIYVPEGTYIVDAATVDQPMIDVDGQNIKIVCESPSSTVIKVKDAATDYLAIIGTNPTTTDTTGLQVLNCTFDHNIANNARVDCADVGAHKQYTVSSLVGTDMAFAGNHVKNASSTRNIQFADNSGAMARITIDDNTFTGLGNPDGVNGFECDSSVIYTHADDVSIRGNTIHSEGSFPSMAKTAIETHGSRHTVSGNKIKDFRRGILPTGIATTATEGTVIADNTIENAMIGINPWTNDNFASPTYGIDGMTITGNTITLAETEDWGANATHTTGGINIDPGAELDIRGLTIANNVIIAPVEATAKPASGAANTGNIGIGWRSWDNDDCTANEEPVLCCTGLDTGICERKLEDSSIVGNTVIGFPMSGIRLMTGTLENVRISGNILKNVGSTLSTATTAYESPISIIPQAVDGLAITDNVFYDDIATTRIKQFVYLQCLVSAEEIYLRDNTYNLEGSTTTEYDRPITIQGNTCIPHVDETILNADFAVPVGQVMKGSHFRIADTRTIYSVEDDGTTWRSTFWVSSLTATTDATVSGSGSLRVGHSITNALSGTSSGGAAINMIHIDGNDDVQVGVAGQDVRLSDQVGIGRTPAGGTGLYLPNDVGIYGAGGGDSLIIKKNASNQIELGSPLIGGTIDTAVLRFKTWGSISRYNCDYDWDNDGDIDADDIDTCYDTAVAALGTGEAGSDNAIVMYIPEGRWNMAAHFPWAAKSGLTIQGVPPRNVFYGGTPPEPTPDGVMDPNGGTWLDCGGSETTCISGDSLRGFNIRDVGFENFDYGITIGGDGLDGIALSEFRNLAFVGRARALPSDDGTEWPISITNGQQIRISNVKVNHTQNGLILRCQHDDWEGPNAIVEDYFIQAYAMNSTDPDLGARACFLVESIDGVVPAPFTQLGCNYVQFIRPQCNVNTSDNPSGSAIFHLKGTSSSAVVNGITVIGGDFEGLTEAAVKLDYTTNSYIHLAGAVQGTTSHFLVDANSSGNTLMSTYDRAKISTANNENNLWYGIYDDDPATNFDAVKGVWRSRAGGETWMVGDELDLTPSITGAGTDPAFVRDRVGLRVSATANDSDGTTTRQDYYGTDLVLAETANSNDEDRNLFGARTRAEFYGGAFTGQNVQLFFGNRTDLYIGSGSGTTMAQAGGLYVSMLTGGTPTGSSITNLYGVRISDWGTFSGTVQNNFGLFVGDMGNKGNNSDTIRIDSQTGGSAAKGNIRFIGGAYNNGHMQFGSAVHLWQDGSGNLRYKGSAPSSATDGAEIGEEISVNGTAASDGDFDDATPTAPAGDLNVKWQKDTSAPDNISAYVDVSVLEPLLTLDNLNGQLAITKGGTGAASKTAGFDALSPLTSKGDLVCFDGANNVRLPVSVTDGEVLTVNAAQTCGFHWAAAAAASVEDNILINTAAVTDADFNDTTPTAPAGDLNVIWQKDASSPANVSSYVDVSALESLLVHDNIGGTLGIAKGGTGQTAQTPAFDALAPGTTKGDILVYNGTDHVRLAVGTNGQQLEADSTQATGLKWAAAGGGGGGQSSMGFSGAATTVAKGNTDYLGIGTGKAASTEANQNFYCPTAGTISKMRTYVSANGTGADGNTITLRKNGASQSVTVTYNTGETGLKSDTSNSFTVAAGDTISIQVVNQGSGGGTKDLVVETVTFEFAP